MFANKKSIPYTPQNITFDSLPSKVNATSNMKLLNEYEKKLNEMGKKIQNLQKSLANNEFDDKQINTLRTYEKEIFELVFQIDNVLIMTNERALDDKYQKTLPAQTVIREKVMMLLNRAKFLREQLKMIQDWEDNIDDEDRNESLDIITLTQIIFLPLSFLTGYFGMNFIKKIPKGWSQATLLEIMFFISIVIVMVWILYKYNYFNIQTRTRQKKKKGKTLIKKIRIWIQENLVI